jgi:tetratricopeptide (TPR) repeat protein
MEPNRHGRQSIRLAAVLLAALGAALPVAGTEEPHQHTSESLGSVSFPVSCSPEAQVEFNRAVALLHHMTYPQARRAFARVAEIDGSCGMAHWGIAMTLFQPLWPTRPSAEELERGWQEVEKARGVGALSAIETLFVAATEAFFREPAAGEYWQRIQRWESGMERVYNAFPEDPEAAVFYALAHLAVAPTDRVSPENSARAAELLLAVYKANPDHPGAMHYMIHANDAPGRERELLEVVHKYELVAPDNPHALHMPTHIYTRLGDWESVIRGNLRAADAALLYPAGDHQELVWDEFPHAIEYLVYAYLQEGADDKAAVELARLRETVGLQPSFKTAFHLASTQARYALERRDWSEAAAIVPRQAEGLDWDLFKWPEAISWFARGRGAVQQGWIDQAKQAAEHLAALEAAARESGEALFARNIQILALELGGWTAAGEGDPESGLELLRRAAELESSTPKHPVTPGPTLPAWEQLGDLLLDQGSAREALTAYESSLALYPGRFNSLLGAARAAALADDATLARTYYQTLLGLAAEGARPAEVREARDFVTAAGS